MICVKICGITSIADAKDAIEAGADAIGLNFVAGTPRALEEAVAREISLAIAGRAVRVGVFRDAPLDTVLAIGDAVQLDMIQLHGDESPEYVAQIPLPVLKVLAAGDGLAERAARYPKVDLLLDHPSPAGAADRAWDFGARPDRWLRAGRRVWLAGGLGRRQRDAEAVAPGASSRASMPHPGLESARRREGRGAACASFIEAARAVSSALPVAPRPSPSERGYFGEFGGPLRTRVAGARRSRN